MSSSGSAEKMASLAAQLITSYKSGIVLGNVAAGLKAVFPEALLLSISVPSRGLSDVVLVSTSNFMEEGHTSIALCSLKTSVAGQSFSANQICHSLCDTYSHLPGQHIRHLDAEYAQQRWSASNLLCCPISTSVAERAARQSVAEDSTGELQGVLSLGLKAGAALTARVEDALRELAMHLSETIKHVSKGLVDDVCHYHLGAPRVEDEALAQTPSASCSDPGQGGSSGGFPDGSLPQLVTPENEGGTEEGDPVPGPPQVAPRGDCAAEGTPGPSHQPLKRNGLASEENGAKAGPSGKTLNGAAKWGSSLIYRGKEVDTCDAKAAGCLPSPFEEDAYKPLKNGKRLHSPMLDFSRTATLTFVDPALESEFRSWHARQRWQWDAAGLVFMLFVTVIARLNDPAMSGDLLAQRLWLACGMHLVPLLCIAANLPWYLRNRDRMLPAYLALAAFHTVYLCNRTAVRLEPMVALRSLIWFSRVQGAEPLLFHSMMFVVRFRTALLAQAICVLMAVSNAAALCSTCCTTFMRPAFCLVKAVATQAVFGYGLPLAIIYYTEQYFRQIFAESRVHST